MARRGSENRQKVRSVLVRMTETEYQQLTAQAEREGTSRADYLRRHMRDALSEPGRTDSGDDARVLSEADRILLAGATRSMGHLAGLMKLAVLKTPISGSSASVRSILDEHHGSLQELQSRIRALMERLQ